METPPHVPSAPRRRLRAPATALLLFAAAFAIRLLFLHATPDAAWPYSACYKGDAPVWLEYARAIRSGGAFEAGLPLRPPGMGYLLAAAGPDRIPFLNVLWCALGAGVPVLFYLAARRGFGESAAVLVGAGTAVSTGLLLLSTSLNNETPYLVLLGGSLIALDAARGRRAHFASDAPPPSPTLREPSGSSVPPPGKPQLGTPLEPAGGRPGHPPLRTAPDAAREPIPLAPLLAWSVLGALACQVRVEHVLFHLLGTLFLLATWRGAARTAWARRLAVLATGFVLPLVPWHAHAWSSIDRFNHTRQELGEGFETVAQGVEALGGTGMLDPSAERAAAALPAYGRHYWTAFVIGTVVHRGRTRVTAEDFGILEDAFGVRPEAIRPFPFVTLYGPLNFHLANNPLAVPGFSRDALDRPPPLAGNEERYPPRLLGGLPPEDGLSFAYPPHVAAINHGYRMGAAWILENPGAFLSLAGKRLLRFWEGAALGVTGYGAPLGLEGTRRRVDLLTPHNGTMELLWRSGLAALFLFGVLAARREVALVPWLLLLASKLVTAAFFFGYARIGATTVPVIVLGVALAMTRRGPARSLRAAAFLAALLLAGGVAAEAVRFAAPPRIVINGRPAGETDPYPAGLYIDMPVAVRF